MIKSIKYFIQFIIVIFLFIIFFLIGKKLASNLSSYIFKTFGKFCDEKYDTHFDHDERMKGVLSSIDDVLKLSNEEIHRKLYGDSWDGSVNEGGWKKLFDILEHNHNHLPIHANNQKVKISKVIQKFMDKS